MRKTNLQQLEKEYALLESFPEISVEAFKEAFAGGTSSKVMKLMTKVLSKRLSGIGRLLEDPFLYKNSLGSFAGYYVVFKTIKKVLRVNFLLNKSDRIYSIDFYNKYFQKEYSPSFTYTLDENMNIQQIVRMITEVITKGPKAYSTNINTLKGIYNSTPVLSQIKDSMLEARGGARLGAGAPNKSGIFYDFVDYMGKKQLLALIESAVKQDDDKKVTITGRRYGIYENYFIKWLDAQAKISEYWANASLGTTSFTALCVGLYKENGGKAPQGGTYVSKARTKKQRTIIGKDEAPAIKAVDNLVADYTQIKKMQSARRSAFKLLFEKKIGEKTSLIMYGGGGLGKSSGLMEYFSEKGLTVVQYSGRKEYKPTEVLWKKDAFKGSQAVYDCMYDGRNSACIVLDDVNVFKSKDFRTYVLLAGEQAGWGMQNLKQTHPELMSQPQGPFARVMTMVEDPADRARRLRQKKTAPLETDDENIPDADKIQSENAFILNAPIAYLTNETNLDGAFVSRSFIVEYNYGNAEIMALANDSFEKGGIKLYGVPEKKAKEAVFYALAFAEGAGVVLDMRLVKDIVTRMAILEEGDTMEDIVEGVVSSYAGMNK